MLSDAICERARLSRDRRFDGRFFIGVLTTGIYCRPVCPVRPPKAKNVQFFASAAAAAEAGFRPCLRCRPETSPGTPAWSGTSATVSRALRFIGDGALDGGRQQGASVGRLAERLGVSTRHLSRLFAEHVGAAPLSVAHTRRLHFAKCLIDDSALPMTEVAMSAGFGSVRRFHACIHETYARTPRELRSLAQRSHKHRHERDSGVSMRLGYRPPYPWSAVLAFLAARAIDGVERVSAESYTRSVTLRAGIGFIELRHVPEAHHLSLRIEGAEATELMDLVERVRRAFDLTANPQEIARHLRGDALLRGRLRRLPGVRLVGGVDAFEIAVRAVLGQGVRLAQATALAGRLCACFGRALEPMSGGTPATRPSSLCRNGLLRAFPTPSALASADIECIGVPSKRAEAIRQLAHAAIETPEVLRATPDVDAFIARLLALPGIGPWTAQYTALRGVGEPDALPASDTVLRQRAGADGTSLASRELSRVAERWRPWRSYATMLLWSCP
jgi:AraC family transcriptional regulator of adaptative response / DNA-3-methyladenine glycosylase II